MNDGAGDVDDGVEVDGRRAGGATVPDVGRVTPSKVRVVAVCVLAVAAAAAVLALVASQRPWVFETTVGLGALAGLGLATGALDHLPRRHGGPRVVDHTDPALRTALWDRLATLDPLEHRRLELGDPWPSLVVGPTGVSVVAPASLAHAHVAAQLRTVAVQVEHELAGTAAARLPVRALLVVDRDGGAPRGDRPALVDGVPRVEVDTLLDVLARGTLAPLSVIESAHRRLAAHLVNELPAAS